MSCAKLCLTKKIELDINKLGIQESPISGMNVRFVQTLLISFTRTYLFT